MLPDFDFERTNFTNELLKGFGSKINKTGVYNVFFLYLGIDITLGSNKIGGAQIEKKLLTI